MCVSAKCALSVARDPGTPGALLGSMNARYELALTETGFAVLALVGTRLVHTHLFDTKAEARRWMKWA